MRSLCGMRSHSSLTLSSLLSTLPQVHASAAHHCGPAASDLVSGLPHMAAMLQLHLARSTCMITSWAKELARSCPRAKDAVSCGTVGTSTSSS